MQTSILGIVAAVFLLVSLFSIARRLRRCPSDKILVVYGKISGKGLSARCYHGGAAFIWPLLQDYAFLDLHPLAIDIKLEGALSMQNIRVNTPSTFTVGISTEPGVMENAAERLLGMDMKQIAELARDIIFGQMRVVLATMPIEEINADRDKLIENISNGVEVELKKIGLRLINVNIQDITDESGYIDALGKEAAARAINEAKVKVAEQERDGAIGAANADRDQRIQVSSAQATAVDGENTAKISMAQSNARRREQEAEAERSASAAEKVKAAQSLEESYKAEELAERQRAEREQATQYANIVVPAEIEKSKIETLAEAEAEKIRRMKKGEADGLRSVMEAEAEGLRAILTKKAEGFDRIVAAARDLPELAALLLVTEQLPKLVEEQVKAISNLKIDSVTVWEGGRNGEGGSGKTATADFLSGLVGSLPPLHELTRNVGIKLPEYLGHMERAGGAETPPRTGGGPGGGSEGSAGGTGEGEDDADPEPPSAPRAAPPGPSMTSAAAAPAGGKHREARATSREARGAPEKSTAPETAAPSPPAAPEATGDGEAARSAEPPGEGLLSTAAREALRRLLEAQPGMLAVLDQDKDGKLEPEDLDRAVDAVVDWARKAKATAADWYYADQGRWSGPASWEHIQRLARERPWLPVNLAKEKLWLPFEAIEQARRTLGGSPD